MLIAITGRSGITAADGLLGHKRAAVAQLRDRCVARDTTITIAALIILRGLVSDVSRAEVPLERTFQLARHAGNIQEGRAGNQAGSRTKHRESLTYQIL